MKTHVMASLVLLSTAVHAAALAQSNDTAAERGRLANQRIQLEAERRAREEDERRQQAAELARLQQETAVRADAERVQESSQPPLRAAREDTSDESAPAAIPSANTVPADKVDLSRTLEQLRTLGELRDAGYVTQEEFERIKRKILDQ
ncbi:MAG: SHOCT domain-containing protein [Gammaproteobacteria bacterium]|nr:SHOCT domain-containing protein [Gammaproteobacteria bacterium]